jgi:hypothetical protein
MDSVSVSENQWYTLTKPTLGVSCDLLENRECMTLSAGTTVQPTHGIDESGGVMHVKWGEKLVMMFTQDFQRNTAPSL